MKLINNFVYTRLTHQSFIWQPFYSIEVVILGLGVWVYYNNEVFLAQTNKGLGLLPVPTKMLMYADAYFADLNTEEFDVQFFVGLVSSLYFVRLLLTLVLTQTFGPIISTIIYMFNDIAVFIVIWFITLLGFTLVAQSTFNRVPDFLSFDTAIIFWINAAFGNYDLGVFDVYLEA